MNSRQKRRNNRVIKYSGGKSVSKLSTIKEMDHDNNFNGHEDPEDSSSSSGSAGTFHSARSVEDVDQNEADGMNGDDEGPNGLLAQPQVVLVWHV